MTRAPRRTSASSGDESTPTSFPQTTPGYASPGHDFTLQAVMELQKSIGAMSTKLDRVVDDVKSQGADIKAISAKINYFLGGAAVLGAIIGIVITFTLRMPWDKIIQSTPAHSISSGSDAAQKDSNTNLKP